MKLSRKEILKIQKEAQEYLYNMWENTHGEHEAALYNKLSSVILQIEREEI